MELIEIISYKKRHWSWKKSFYHTSRLGWTFVRDVTLKISLIYRVCIRVRSVFIKDHIIIKFIYYRGYKMWTSEAKVFYSQENLQSTTKVSFWVTVTYWVKNKIARVRIFKHKKI